MPLRTIRFFFVLLLAAAFAGCSSQPGPETSKADQPNTKPAKKASESAQLEAGREALQKMYASARLWAPDSQPLSLASNPRKGDTAGKAAVWSSSFASAGKRSIRNFMWSGAAGEDAPDAGVSQGSIDVYSPENASTRPFDMNFLKIDSTEAFETAQKHGGATLLKKTPDMITQYKLLWDPRAARLVWSIKYAPSGDEAKLNAVINASTGQFIHIEK